MKKWFLAILFVMALVLGACGGGNDNDNAEEPADNNDNAGTEEATDEGNDNGSVDTAAAEEIYSNNCAACHGADLSGGAGPDLTKVGSNHSAKDIEDIIHNGTGSMPAQSQVSDEDASTLAGWLADKK